MTESQRDVWAEIDQMKEELEALTVKRAVLEQHAAQLKELHDKLSDNTYEAKTLLHDFYHILNQSPPGLV